MAMDADSNRPVIIKKKKVIAGGGHHGGAWKVAYADFVTAMMAFFMLMWLLNATTEQQRKGIADYFTPTIAFSRASGGGDGTMYGDTVFITESLAASGRGGNASLPVHTHVRIRTAESAKEEAELESLIEELLGFGGESALMDNALTHIVTRMTDEGLVIEVFDLPNAPLFQGDTDTPEPITEIIIEMLAKVLAAVTNDVAIRSHVKTETVLRRTNPIWDITTTRSARARLMLESGGLDPQRVARLTGAGDKTPIVSDATTIRNNRIELVVLRSDQLEYH
mgnify:CR=1 FL=1